MGKEGGHRATVPPRERKRISEKVEADFREIPCFLGIRTVASWVWLFLHGVSSMQVGVCRQRLDGQ